MIQSFPSNGIHICVSFKTIFPSEEQSGIVLCSTQIYKAIQTHQKKSEVKDVQGT